jgi:hypothetical protein
VLGLGWLVVVVGWVGLGDLPLGGGLAWLTRGGLV